MQMADGLKLLKIDGVAPDAESIGSGEYPFLNPYYAAINAAEPEDSMAACSSTGCSAGRAEAGEPGGLRLHIGGGVR